MLDPQSAVAASICHLARLAGLPHVTAIRSAVVQRHQEPCGWCDYPLPELAGMIANFDDTSRAAHAFRASRPETQRRLVDQAQGMEVAA